MSENTFKISEGNQMTTKSNKTDLKKIKLLLSIAAVLFILLISIYKITPLNKKRRALKPTSFELPTFQAQLKSADFSPTDLSRFGGDGVHSFSNLYFNSSHFLVNCSNNNAFKNEDLNFFGEGNYNYDVHPFTNEKFEKWTGTSYKIPGTTVILASSDEMKSLQPHYFHFLEEFLLAWSAHKGLKTPSISCVIFPDINHWEGVNEINKQILESLIPHVKILNKDQFKELSSKNLVQFEHAVVVDRQACHNQKEVQIFNKMAISHANLIESSYLKEFRDKVWSQLKTYDHANRKPTITYIRRKNRRYLDPDFEKVFLSTLEKKFPNHKIQPVWFEKLTFAQQLQIIRNSDILIGAHGNGLTHSYFLPDNSLVLELFPDGAFAMDYQLISEFSGHNYYAIDSKLGIVSTAGHHMPPRGNVNQVIEAFDLNWITKPIEAHIQGNEDSEVENEISFKLQPLTKE
ncbi:MAG: hypothetical protein S4CHLAM7_14040 [Chlamydiae bacterium]|nr:hypothetical protein [Chlamydiota bacterium]